MNFFSYTDQFIHPLFARRDTLNRKELFLSPTAAVFQNVEHAHAVLGPFIDQFCMLVLTLEKQDYEQIGMNAWALSLDSLLALPETQQEFFVRCLLKNIDHIATINDERSSIALELKTLRKQFQELNNDFLVIAKKMARETKRKLLHKDALIYASQKIGKTGGFEINLVTQRTESTPFLLEMLGIEKFDPLSVQPICSEASHKRFRNAVARLLEGEESNSFETEYDDGVRVRTFQVDLAGLKNAEGKVHIVRGSMKDISLLKNLERENEKQKAIAVSASKLASLGEMAGGVAHEINNPMAIITGLLYKLKHRFEANRLDKDEFDSIFEKAQKSVKRITYIVAGLRSFSRDGSNDQVEMKSVRAILEDTLLFCEAKLREKGIRLDYSEVPHNLMIPCRPTEISQVFLNLINNATDAVLELEEKWIRFEAQEGGGLTRITVTDSGPGIDAAIADKIINPFFTTKEFGKGTGLGLSISHGIAKRHGGSLFLNRECERTQFVLLIPNTQLETERAGSVDPEIKKAD